jgi:hypothetical protein
VCVRQRRCGFSSDAGRMATTSLPRRLRCMSAFTSGSADVSVLSSSVISFTRARSPVARGATAAAHGDHFPLTGPDRDVPEDVLWLSLSPLDGASGSDSCFALFGGYQAARARAALLGLAPAAAEARRIAAYLRCTTHQCRRGRTRSTSPASADWSGALSSKFLSRDPACRHRGIPRCTSSWRRSWTGWNRIARP